MPIGSTGQTSPGDTAARQDAAQTMNEPIVLLHGPLTESERKEYEREKKEEKRRREEMAYKERQLAINEGQLTANRRIARYTLVLAGLNILGLLASLLSSQAAKQSSEAAMSAIETANRPYIGCALIAARDNPNEKNLSFAANFRNFGTVPGTEVRVGWEVYQDGIRQRGTKIPDDPSTLFPTQGAVLTGRVGLADYQAIVAGRSTFRIKVFATYSGPSGKKYRYCEVQQFAPYAKGFVNLGNGCGEPTK